MSAFLLGDKHINALATYAAHPRRHIDLTWIGVPTTDRAEIARCLQWENLRSLVARYGEVSAAPIAPAIVSGLSAVEIIKACNCYDYQSCETDDYEQTIAAKIIRAVRDRAITELPGYDAAPWGIDC